jgi:ketosteroid isomerase-like protein
MKIPAVVAGLVKAQNNYDSMAYANCFAEEGVMFDEGETHKGRLAIQQHIAAANDKYRAVMKPLDFIETGDTGVLSAEISGTFDGSPIVLKFHFEILGDLIRSLKVTG